jgi:hypothetical protein
MKIDPIVRVHSHFQLEETTEEIFLLSLINLQISIFLERGMIRGQQVKRKQ